MPAPIDPSPLGEKLEAAVAFALAAFRTDKRAWSDGRFVARIFGVAAVALENGASENEAAAAILYRSVDRRNAQAGLARIRRDFGDEVGTIVEACSDVFVPSGPTSQSTYDGALATIERLGARTGDGTFATSFAPGILLVSAAGTYYDARATLERLREGEDAFATLPGKKFGALWSYRVLADAYRRFGERGSDARCARFAELTIELVDTMAGKPVTTDELRAAFAIDDTVDPRDKGTLLTASVAS